MLNSIKNKVLDLASSVLDCWNILAAKKDWEERQTSSLFYKRKNSLI